MSHSVAFHNMRAVLPCLILLLLVISGKGQVPGLVQMDRQNESDQTEFHISWSIQAEQKWKADNQDRLEIMAVRTDIKSSSVKTSNSLTSFFKLSLPNQSQIEALIEFEQYEAGEELHLIDAITKEVIYSVIDFKDRRVLTPPFNPQTTLFSWSGKSSIFSIRTVYIQESQADRGGPTIGFNTALSCHPNAACKQDSILQLISNSAVRIRMVMEEGIGWCTGSFINNTKNDKTPYVLTAHHCTFEYTPKYDLWRFDLQYKSDSCTNPANEPSFFSMVGCEFKSTLQASDYLLVLLDNPVPMNQAVTFAGWNKNDSTSPDTSYLIHHPNADIRKISTCINKATIHPNQISWSDGAGYTTPGNHHYRLKFTEGGHQAGSSGGPLYDQDGLLVGQLHGGTMGCEVVNTAYIGRISRSWNTGATPEERLLEWLDPDNAGAITWPSLENLSPDDLTEIHGTILNPFGFPVKNVKLLISGSIKDTVETNAEGQFTLAAINRNGQYTITPVKNINQTNGLSVLDLVSIQKHLLQKDTFDFQWQHVASDATNNAAVSVGDILLLAKLMLGKITFLPSSPSWRFVPAVINIDTIPLTGPLEVTFEGIKIGDVNGTANPSQ